MKLVQVIYLVLVIFMMGGINEEGRAITNKNNESMGGQVIESGPYHLELLPVRENEGINLKFYLQKGDTHESISDAKVTAQIQLPNGEQKTMDLTYDSAGQYYGGLLNETAAGEYKLVIQTDINGEKVNGRFSFTK